MLRPVRRFLRSEQRRLTFHSCDKISPLGSARIRSLDTLRIRVTRRSSSRIFQSQAESRTRRQLRSVVAESWVQANGAYNGGG